MLGVAACVLGRLYRIGPVEAARRVELSAGARAQPPQDANVLQGSDDMATWAQEIVETILQSNDALENIIKELS